MSDIKLFALQGDSVTELNGQAASLEKDLQRQIEQHMESFLGVRFLATEHSTGRTHKGRIDSLGLDENNFPVIIEYKRHQNENVINQGLFYLDWLMDHQAEFQLLTMRKLGLEVADNIEWSGTRLICIATDFNKYDEHAVQQIDRNIELMRYRYFGKNLLLLELVYARNASTPPASKNGNITISTDPTPISTAATRRRTDKTQAERLQEASPELVALYDNLCAYIEQLGDEVQRKELVLYTAFKRIKNFASVLVLPQNRAPRLQLFLKLPGETTEDGFTRDVSKIGHWGTGDMEVNVRTADELEKAKVLVLKGYERS
jgi:predicted transport protein